MKTNTNTNTANEFDYNMIYVQSLTKKTMYPVTHSGLTAEKLLDKDINFLVYQPLENYEKEVRQAFWDLFLRNITTTTQLNGVPVVSLKPSFNKLNLFNADKMRNYPTIFSLHYRLVFAPAKSFSQLLRRYKLDYQTFAKYKKFRFDYEQFKQIKFQHQCMFADKIREQYYTNVAHKINLKNTEAARHNIKKVLKYYPELESMELPDKYYEPVTTTVCDPHTAWTMDGVPYTSWTEEVTIYDHNHPLVKSQAFTNYVIEQRYGLAMPESMDEKEQRLTKAIQKYNDFMTQVQSLSFEEQKQLILEYSASQDYEDYLEAQVELNTTSYGQVTVAGIRYA